MERQGDEVHVNETEASAGSRPHMTRWILGISLILVTVLLSIIWITGSLTS